MSASNFDRCLSIVLHHEGGYVNDRRDPGGETNMGISRRAYPHEDIRGMTRDRAAAIYRRDYWRAIGGDALPPGVDLVTFDAAVNSGVSRASSWLQRSVGAGVDGDVGQATVAAARAADARRAVLLAVDARERFLKGLKSWPRFGGGWKKRLDDVRSNALAMIAEPVDEPMHVEMSDAEAAAIKALVAWRAQAPGDIAAFARWIEGIPA